MKTAFSVSWLFSLIAAFASVSCGAGDRGEVANRSAGMHFVIVATEPSAKQILAKKQSVAGEFSNLEYVSTDDCQNLKPGLFLLVSSVHKESDDVEEVLEQAREIVPDAYSRPCEVVEGSRLALGVPPIDPSIESAPAELVNWSDEDRISEVLAVDEAGYLYIRRQFVKEDMESTEGRRQTVEYISPDQGRRMTIREHCWDFREPYMEKELLVMQCATGRAANHLIHESLVYDVNKQEMVVVENYCRDPELVDAKSLECKKEQVSAQGELKLDKKSIEL